MEQVLSVSKKEKDQKEQAIVLGFAKEKIFILSSIFLAFLIRIYFIPHNIVINGDGIYYATLGKRIVSGDVYGGISAYWSPLYSLLVGIASLFFDEVEFGGRFVSILAGSILIVPAYFLIRDLYSRLTAIFGTILLIFHPLLIKSSGWVMTESLYTLIFTTGILSTWYALRDYKSKTFFFTGILFGVAYLTKPEAIGFLVLLLVLTFATKFFRRDIELRRCAVGYLFLLAGFMIFFLPYIIFLHEKTGRWTISQKVMANLPLADYEGNLLELTEGRHLTMQDRIWGDHYDNDTEIQEPADHSPKVSEFEEPKDLKSTLTILGYKAQMLLIKQLKDYLPIILPYLLIFVAFIGFICDPFTKYRIARELFLFSFFACTIIGYAVSAVELRYLFPLIPVLICWVANGTVGFGNWVATTLSEVSKAKWKIHPQFVQVLVLLVLIVALIPLYLVYFAPANQQNVPFEEKRAGLWIKNNSNSPLVVMASHANVAFYAGAKHLFVPDEQFPVVLEYAQRKKVDYLVFSQRRLKISPTAFPPEGQDISPGIELVYKDDQDPEYKILVYKILH